MSRLHLFEFEDQTWLPAPIRDGQTAFFTFMSHLTAMPFRDFGKMLAAAMRKTGDTVIVELGSGGGGQAIGLARQVQLQSQSRLKLILTDLFPNLPALRFAKTTKDIDVDICEEPVDAMAVPTHLKGFRVICNAFHHLPPQVGVAAIGDAVKQRQGFAIMEFVGRSPEGFIQLLTGLIAMFFVMPFVRPFSLTRLFFTYVVPLIPLTTLWDGIASCMRVYSPDELKALVAQLPANDYTWDIGRIKVPMAPIRITFLIGIPGQN